MGGFSYKLVRGWKPRLPEFICARLETAPTGVGLVMRGWKPRLPGVRASRDLEIENFAGVHDVARVKRVFDCAHEANCVAVLLL